MSAETMETADRDAWPHPIKTVGVIGLGTVGLSICRRLSSQGHKFGFRKVAGFDPGKAADERVDGAEIILSKSIPHLVDMVDLVLLCLPGEGAVGKIARSHEGLLDCVRQGQIIVDHGWSPLDLTRQLATAFTARGAAFLDAPIARSGDVERMIETGRLALAVGGDAVAVEAVLPMLGGFASDVTRVGTIGAAQVVRQVGDLVALQTFAALAEAMMTAGAFGVDGDRLLDALSKGQGDGVGFGRRRLAEFLGVEDDAAEERPSIADAGRRLRDAIELARSKKLTLAGADSTLTLIEKAIDSGLGENDLSGLLRVMGPEPRTKPRDERPHHRLQRGPI